MKRVISTSGPDATEAFGEALGRSAPAGGLLGLVGDLGAGKTCLVRGLARGLGADPERVHSPSFVMVTEYPGTRHPLVHVDLYRLEPHEIDEISLREFLYGAGVAAVEWFDRLPSARPAEVLLLTLHHAGGDERRIEAEAHGPRHATWLTAAVGE
jgi:tRNA threonylcarbamoyladenosine biosynthesis protein TsaE